MEKINCPAVNPPINSKRQALEYIALRLAAVAAAAAKSDILAALTERERLGSTGLGNGIALPHALMGELASTYTLLATLNEPIDFEAADKKPVEIIFALIAPKGQSHVPTLSRVARLLRDTKNRKRLLAAADETELMAVAATSFPGNNSR